MPSSPALSSSRTLASLPASSTAPSEHTASQPAAASPARPDSPKGPGRSATGAAGARERALEDAKTFFDATEGGVTGVGTNRDKMFSSLEGKSAEDLGLMRQAYRQQYGHDLDSVAHGRLSGDDRKRFDALMQGPSGKAVSDSLAIGSEIHSNWADQRSVLDRLEKSTPQERSALVDAYAKHYGPAKAGQSAQDFFLGQMSNKFDKAQMAQAQGLLTAKAQSSAEADAAKIHAALGFFSNDKQAVQSALQGKTKEQIAEIDTAYRKNYGESLASSLGRSTSGASRDVLLRQLDPPQTPRAQARASAERLHEAVQGVGTDLPTIRQELQGKSRDEIAAISDAYRQKTGEPLRDRLSSELSGAERDGVLHQLDIPDARDNAAMSQWKTDGQAKQLRLAVEGVGADEASIKDVLQNNSQKDNQAVAKAYARLYGGENLRDRLTSELGDRDRLELVNQLFDHGAVAHGDVRESINRLGARVEFEKSGLGFTDLAQKAFHVGQSNYESDAHRMQRHLTDAKQALGRGDAAKAGDEAGYAHNDLKTNIANREAAADAAATGAAVTAAVGVTVLSGGTATPLVLGAAALASGTSTAAVHYSLNGQAGAGHALTEGAIATVTGAVPLGKGAQLAERAGAGMLERTGSRWLASGAEGAVHAGRSAVQGAEQGALQGGLRSASRGDTWRDGNGLTNVVRDTGLGGVTGLLTGGATDGALRIGMAGLPLARKGVDAAGQMLGRPRTGLPSGEGAPLGFHPGRTDMAPGAEQRSPAVTEGARRHQAADAQGQPSPADVASTQPTQGARPVDTAAVPSAEPVKVGKAIPTGAAQGDTVAETLDPNTPVFRVQSKSMALEAHPSAFFRPQDYGLKSAEGWDAMYVSTDAQMLHELRTKQNYFEGPNDMAMHTATLGDLVQAHGPGTRVFQDQTFNMSVLGRPTGGYVIVRPRFNGQADLNNPRIQHLAPESAFQYANSFRAYQRSSGLTPTPGSTGDKLSKAIEAVYARAEMTESEFGRSFKDVDAVNRDLAQAIEAVRSQSPGPVH